MDLTLKPTPRGHLAAGAKSADIDLPALKEPLELFERAVAQESELRLARDKAEHQIEQAEKRDAEDTATALERGTKDPGSRHVQAARQALVDAERRWRGSQISVDRARLAFNEAVAEHGPEFERHLLDVRAAKVKALLSAIDKAEKAHAELVAVQRLLNLGSGGPMWLTVDAPRPLDGDEVLVSSLFERLRGLGHPKPKPVTNPDQVRQHRNPMYVEPDEFAATEQPLPAGVAVIDGAVMFAPTTDNED